MNMSAVTKQSGAWPKWQIALAIGAPIAVGLAYWYLKESKSKRKREYNISENDVRNVEPLSDASEEQQNVDNARQDPYEIAKGYKNRGNKYFKEGKYDKAIECYTEAIAVCPDSKRIDLSTFYQNRAAAYENLRNYSEVIKDCSEAIELNKMYVKAMMRRGKAFEATNDLESAFEDLTAVCIIEHFQNMPSLQFADRLLKMQSKEEAKDLVANRPKDLPSKHFITNYFVSFSDDPVLKEVAEYKNKEKSELSPNLSGYSLVIHLLAEERYDEVIEACTSEIESNGERLAEALLVRGTFYLLKCEMEPSQTDLRRLIAMEHANVKLRVNALIKLGALKVQFEQLPEAMKEFEEAVKLDPNNADVYLHRGQIMLLIDNMEKTLADMEQSVSLNPDFPSARAQKCYVQYRYGVQQGDEKKVVTALKEFEEILETLSTSTECLLLYAQVLCEREEFQRAEELFIKAETLNPSDPNVYVHKGILLLQWKQDIDGAISLLNKAIELDEKCQFAYETLGSVEVQRGNLQKGIELFQTAVDLAHNESELLHLISLRNAAKAQLKVAERLGLPLGTHAAFQYGNMVNGSNKQ